MSDLIKWLENEEIKLPPGVAIYITDQSHPTQLEKLPPNATPGFAVSVYRKHKCLESMWVRTREQADQMAQEYYRQYATMQATGWR